MSLYVGVFWTVVAVTRRRTALASLVLQNNHMVTLSASLKANEESTRLASKLPYVSISHIFSFFLPQLLLWQQQQQ